MCPDPASFNGSGHETISPSTTSTIYGQTARLLYGRMTMTVTIVIGLRTRARVHINWVFASEASSVTNCANLRFLVYIFIYLYICMSPYVLFGPARRKRRTGRLRFKGQYNRPENGYFSSKPWLEIGFSYEAADLPTYM